MCSAVDDDGSTAAGSLIDEIMCEGARRMHAAALEGEGEGGQCIAELAAEGTNAGAAWWSATATTAPDRDNGRRTVEVRAPRVNDRRVDEATGKRKRFSSKILPPWCRKSLKINEVLPLLYLHAVQR